MASKKTPKQKKNNSSLSFRKILLITVTTLLIISPLILAFINIVHHEQQLQKDNPFSVILYDNASVELARESDIPNNAAEDSLTRIFYELINAPPSPTALPENLDRNIFIKASITYNNNAYELICYFAPHSDEGVYIDGTNNAYIIPKEVNKAFLRLPYSEIFYKSAKNYNLVSADNDIIIPSSVNWYYIDSSNNFVQSTKNETMSVQKTYDITSTVNIKFEKKPDQYSITVKDGDAVVYQDQNGNFADLVTLTSESGNDLHVIITAGWQKSPNADRYGNVSYDFFVHIKNKSTITVSKHGEGSSDTPLTSVSRGDFVIVECTNITDISKIIFSSNINGFSPVFRRYNNKAIALIPIPYNKLEEKKLLFSISYGAITESFELEILPDSPPSLYAYNTNLYESEDTPRKAKDKIIKILTGNYSDIPESIYFRGNVFSPQNAGFTLKEKHNSTVIWGEELQYFFVTAGNRYTSNSNNTLVRIAENGVVCQIAENDILGKYVVIDHGCGLRTWYAGLSLVDVHIGDILLAGESIGKTSLNTSTNEYEFLLFCTVYDEIIDPNFLFE